MKEISKKKLVTTRKEHTCYGCLKRISEGVEAVVITGKEDGQHFSIHMHNVCNIMAHKRDATVIAFERGALAGQAATDDYSIDTVTPRPF